LESIQELLYALKVAGRQQVLGITAATENGNGVLSEVATNGVKTKRSRKAVEALRQGALAQMVFEEACRKLPEDVLLRRRLLQVAAEIPGPSTESIREKIFEEMVARFQNVSASS
jgi:hypothetical protein